METHTKAFYTTCIAVILSSGSLQSQDNKIAFKLQLNPGCTCLKLVASKKFPPTLMLRQKIGDNWETKGISQFIKPHKPATHIYKALSPYNNGSYISPGLTEEQTNKVKDTIPSEIYQLFLTK